MLEGQCSCLNSQFTGPAKVRQELADVDSVLSQTLIFIHLHVLLASPWSDLRDTWFTSLYFCFSIPQPIPSILSYDLFVLFQALYICSNRLLEPSSSATHQVLIPAPGARLWTRHDLKRSRNKQFATESQSWKGGISNYANNSLTRIIVKGKAEHFHTTNIYEIKGHNSKIMSLAECLSKWNSQPANFTYK